MTEKLKPIALEDLTPKGKRRIDEICRSATKVLSQKGYWATTMTDISRSTGVSKGGLYHYFQTKEQLLYLIMERYLGRMLAGLAEEAAAIDPPHERIAFLVRRHVQLYGDNIYESRLMFHDMHLLPPNLLEIMVQKSREYRQIWTEAVGSLCTGAGFSKSEITFTTLSLLGMCNWIYLWYDPRGSVDTERLAEQICDVFLGRFGQRVNMIQ